jgi:hypothetical protein
VLNLASHARERGRINPTDICKMINVDEDWYSVPHGWSWREREKKIRKIDSDSRTGRGIFVAAEMALGGTPCRITAEPRACEERRTGRVAYFCTRYQDRS